MRALQMLVSQYDALIFADEIHSPLVLGGRGFTSYASAGRRICSTYDHRNCGNKGLEYCRATECSGHRSRSGTAHALGSPVPEKLPHSTSTIGALGTIEAYTNGDDWQHEVLSVIEGNVRTLSNAFATHRDRLRAPRGNLPDVVGFRGVPELGPHPPPRRCSNARTSPPNEGSTLGERYSQWVRVNLACAPTPAVPGEVPRALVFSHARRGRGRERWASTSRPRPRLPFLLASRAASIPATTVWRAAAAPRHGGRFLGTGERQVGDDRHTGDADAECVER